MKLLAVKIQYALNYTKDFVPSPRTVNSNKDNIFGDVTFILPSDIFSVVDACFGKKIKEQIGTGVDCQIIDIEVI